MRLGIDALLRWHWNRHETTEPALELARQAGVAARTVSYAGFTSLQVALTDQLDARDRGRRVYWQDCTKLTPGRALGA